MGEPSAGADGYIFLLGRTDDVINVGGLKVVPTQFEEFAMGIEEVADCICVPFSDAVTGALRLCIVPKDGCMLDEKRIKQFFMSRMGGGIRCSQR